jgi:HAE1 family hydrophobic/amphiphilic exporter-1
MRGAMVVVQKQSGSNSVEIANKVFEKIPEIQQSLPSDVKLDLIANTSDSIVNTINSLQETIIIILILVVLYFYSF